MPESSGECSSSATVDEPASVIDVDGGEEHGVSEEESFLQTVECRICQEEDSIQNLEVPCVCSGSLKYAHRKCVQHWCNEKGNITCEICHQSYQHGYTAPAPRPEDATIDIRVFEGWTVAGTPLDLRDPRVLAMAGAEPHFLEADYDSDASFCRSAALVLIAILLLGHAMDLSDSDGDDDASKIFSLFLLPAAGFLLPCYIIAWGAISILQHRRQRQLLLLQRRSRS